MKRAALFTLLFFCSVLVMAAPAASEYTIDIHVTSTRMVIESGDSARRQQLDVLIDGKKLQLESESIPNALLSLGDYKAKLVRDEHWRGASYDSNQVYEVLLPDKHTRRFIVVGQSE